MQEIKLNISELKTGQGNVDVEGTIKEIGETRTFNKYGRELSVANAILKDNSGSIKLTLWNDDVTRFKDGDKIKVTNGYVNEFQGEKQLTSGKFGKIEKLGKAESGEETDSDSTEKETETSDESTEEDPEETSDEEQEEPEEVEF